MNYSPFLDSFFGQIDEVGLELKRLPLENIAYQASSKEDYENKLPEFSKLGELVDEEIIGGRRVTVVKLDKPLFANMKAK